MLHGGLRWLEHGHLGLVREELAERSWWIRQAPQLVQPLEWLIPIFRDGEQAKCGWSGQAAGSAISWQPDQA
ncbi:MAG: hypothetical protein CRU78_04925 [Candidatus Accumulibacter phosphatis]|uniref:Uncharacterized protein n=1 Tax=Candidatus Accumulibacter phosphatis TaxID=327160 RepID=A0A6A7RQR2_9PROT|nr:hypothetical protein [Candidatus Accumulibacter phosphatis]